MPTMVPTDAVSRLIKYYYALIEIEREGQRDRVLSGELSERTGEPTSHVRKDLNYFGKFGVPGHGYHVGLLRENLERILGADRVWNAVIIGASLTAQAVAVEGNLLEEKVAVRGVFDDGEEGEKVGSLTVEPTSQLASCVQSHEVLVGIIATLPDRAQDALDALVMAGVPSVVNMSGAVVRPSKGVHVEDVNLRSGVRRLNFYHLNPALRPD